MPCSEEEIVKGKCDGHSHLVEVVENNTKVISQQQGTASTVKWFAGSTVVIVVAIFSIATTVIIWQVDKVTNRLDKIAESVSEIKLTQAAAQASITAKLDDHERRLTVSKK